MEDALKNIRKKQALDSLIRLKGAERYKDTPPKEVIEDKARIPGGLREYKGSKGFFTDILLTAKGMRDVIGEDLYEGIRAFVEPLNEKLGDKNLADQDQIDEGHRYIDLMLAKLAK